MGLLCGHYLVCEDQIPLNLIKCRERMADMKAIYLYAVPQLQQFFIPAFSREGVFFQGFEMRPYNPLAFIIQQTNKRDCIDINADIKYHRYNPERGTNLLRFLILCVSSINRLSESLRMRPVYHIIIGLSRLLTVDGSPVFGVTGILFVAHSDAVMNRTYHICKYLPLPAGTWFAVNLLCQVTGGTTPCPVIRGYPALEKREDPNPRPFY